LGSTTKPVENVRLQAFEVIPEHKLEVLRRLLIKETGRCLVFVRTKRGADKLAKALNHDGLAAAVIHGNRSQSQRTTALTGFQQGRYRVLVATDLASRGIHVEEIVHVINYDLPEAAESFIHRVGRTGRLGKRGCASTLFTRSERADLQKLERTLGISMEIPRSGDSQPERPAIRDERDNKVHTRVERNPRHRSSTARFKMISLRGEVLQGQLGS
jgi:ATP-dependent RNA helicase RhlE